MKKIVLATSNLGKLAEYRQRFEKLPLTLIAQSEFSVPDIAETGFSFIENALIKARHACQHTSLPTFAEDAGLSVDALNGAPGIYSARYAGNTKNDLANINKLLQDLKGIPWQQRTARFHCTIVFMQHSEDPIPLISQGSWEGLILEKPIGENGFGYDSIFFVPTHQCSAAQLSLEIKNQISHRGLAITQLLQNILSIGNSNDIY